MEAYALFVKASAKLGDISEYEPETICAALKLNDQDCEKILAAANVFKMHTAFEDYHVFQKTALVFNDITVDFKTQQELHAPEIEWALATMRLLDPVFPFSNEVLSYIAVCLHEEGFLRATPHSNKEKTKDGLTVQYFLDEVNNHDSAHDDTGFIVQETIHKVVEDYYKQRKDKLYEELKEI
jgi:hypothetical protein